MVINEIKLRFFLEAFTNKGIPLDVEVLQVVLEQGNLFDCIQPLVQSNAVPSGAQFRRLLAQGGVQKNGTRMQDLSEKIENGDVLRIGKRTFVKIEFI